MFIPYLVDPGKESFEFLYVTEVLVWKVSSFAESVDSGPFLMFDFDKIEYRFGGLLRCTPNPQHLMKVSWN